LSGKPLQPFRSVAFGGGLRLSLGGRFVNGGRPQTSEARCERSRPWHLFFLLRFRGFLLLVAPKPGLLLVR
jgi:hypothetical protein